jgi:putative ABC transport system permease protein
MGPGSPLGKTLTFRSMNGQGQMQDFRKRVIGILKDFHQTSLHQAIEPMFFTDDPETGWPQLNIRIRPTNIPKTLAFLEKTLHERVKDFPYSYSFLDDDINGLYKTEHKVRAALGMFTVLAMITACLGLTGLAAFLVERRTKEIGIRKVLGASTRGLVLLQVRDFAAWILLANILAWPAVYYAVGRWLSGYAYHVSPGAGPAAIAAALSLSIALVAVGIKAVQASRANPAASLKYE